MLTNLYLSKDQKKIKNKKFLDRFHLSPRVKEIFATPIEMMLRVVDEKKKLYSAICKILG